MLAADVTVVGGGVIGASCAYFLALAGFDVVLIDRSAPGEGGATAKSKGIIRVFDPIESLGHLAACGVKFYQDWSLFPSLGRSTMVEAGVIYRLAQSSYESARALVRKLHTAKYPIHFCRYGDLGIELSECKWAPSDFVVYEPRGGYGDPPLTATRFAAAAEELGATVLTHRSVESCSRKGSRWTAVCTDVLVESEFLLIAAGAGSLDLVTLPCYARSISLPVFNSRADTQGLAIVDELVGTYIRPVDGETLAVGSQISERAPWQQISNTPSDLHYADAKERLGLIFKDTTITPNRGMSAVGYDLYSNDLLPLIGEMAPSEGLFVATGFSGRGFKMAPAVGVAMAHLLSAKSHRAHIFTLPDVNIAQFKPVATVPKS